MTVMSIIVKFQMKIRILLVTMHVSYYVILIILDV